jgi:hypothetical protein
LFHFSFLILGLLGRGISPMKGSYLHRTTQTQNKRRQTSMPWVGFEPTIPVFARVKTFHAWDRAATVTTILNKPLSMYGKVISSTSDLAGSPANFHRYKENFWYYVMSHRASTYNSCEHGDDLTVFIK